MAMHRWVEWKKYKAIWEAAMTKLESKLDMVESDLKALSLPGWSMGNGDLHCWSKHGRLMTLMRTFP